MIKSPFNIRDPESREASIPGRSSLEPSSSQQDVNLLNFEEDLEQQGGESQQETSRQSYRDANLTKVFRRVRGTGRYHHHSKCQFCDTIVRATQADRLYKHISKCKKIDPASRDSALETGEDEQTSKSFGAMTANVQWNISLAQIIIKNNIPLSFVDCPIPRKLDHQLKPDWQITNRKCLSSKFLPHISKQLTKDFHNSI